MFMHLHIDSNFLLPPRSAMGRGDTISITEESIGIYHASSETSARNESHNISVKCEILVVRKLYFVIIIYLSCAKTSATESRGRNCALEGEDGGNRSRVSERRQ